MVPTCLCEVVVDMYGITSWSELRGEATDSFDRRVNDVTQCHVIMLYNNICSIAIDISSL